MKHIRKFEELDYRELLAQQSKLRQEMEKSRQEEIEKNRKELSGKRLSEISAEVEKSKNNRNLQRMSEYTCVLKLEVG